MRKLFALLWLSCLSIGTLVLIQNDAYAKGCTEHEIREFVTAFAVDDSAAANVAECGPNAVPFLINVLDDASKSEIEHGQSAAALDRIGENASAAVPSLTRVLQSPSESVRTEAAFALGSIGIGNDTTIEILLNMLRQNLESDSGAAAAYALGKIGTEHEEVVTTLVTAMSSTHKEVRSFSITALGELEGRAAEAVPSLVEKLQQDNIGEVRAASAGALGKIVVDDQAVIDALITTLQQDDNDRAKILSAQSLGKIAEALSDRAQTRQQINDDLPTVKRIEQILNNTDFTATQLATQRALTQMSLRKDSLTNQIIRHLLLNGRNIWLAHATFWLALIFVYPRSPYVQAIFFWNPWIRKITGLGYVGFALTWIPFLRTKLFEPFRDSLLSDAALEHFNLQTYFPASEVRAFPSGAIQPIQEALPSVKGQIVLEGSSGLGKTMFLRQLVKRSPRVVVYLPAEKCTKGVIEAIQSKLHGEVIQDSLFLQNLIYSGAIDVCIDGLNEISADTRAKIVEFTENYFQGNIILATQPMEWHPPSTARCWMMQPLRMEHIREFLVSREPQMPTDAPVRGAAYIEACDHYLAQILSGESLEELAVAQQVLSNPMDSTVVALMLTTGQQPDLFHLQNQQYQVMAAEYEAKHVQQPFPLAAFSEAVYRLRLSDEAALPENVFFDEILCMERHKMVISRQSLNAEGQPTKAWYFRHDKIMEFFLLQAFMGKENPRPIEHLGDPRFRGVYFLLAELLPFEEAITLRERLIHYAADSKDHTVSDLFVQVLRSRNKPGLTVPGAHPAPSAS